MPYQPSPDIELLRAAYAAYNTRNIGAALTLIIGDVAWPRAFKGDFVRGSQVCPLSSTGDPRLKFHCSRCAKSGM
jgi:hypothetical protein